MTPTIPTQFLYSKLYPANYGLVCSLWLIPQSRRMIGGGRLILMFVLLHDDVIYSVHKKIKKFIGNFQKIFLCCSHKISLNVI